MAEFSSSLLLLPWTLLVLGTLISRGNSAVPPPDYANTKQVVHKAEGEYGLAGGSNDITIRDSTGHNNLSPQKAQRLTSNDTSCLQNSRFNGNICPVFSTATIHQVFPNECRQCAQGATAAISRIPGYFLACVGNIRLYPCLSKEIEKASPHCTSAATEAQNSVEKLLLTDPELIKSATKITTPCQAGKSPKLQNQEQPTVPTMTTMTTESSVFQPKKSLSQQVKGEQKSPTGKNNDAGNSCFQENGVRPHNTDCNKFQICLHGKWIGKNCELGAYFNPASKTCENSKNILCHRFQTSANKTEDLQQHRSKRDTHGSEIDDDYQHVSNQVEETSDERNSRGYTIPPFGAKIISRKPHPEYCTKFIEFDGHRYFIKDCGPGTVYLPFIYACGWPHMLGKIYDRNDCKAYRYCSESKYYSGRCPHGQNFDPFKQACTSGFKCLPAYPVTRSPSTTRAPPPPPPPPTTTVYYTTPTPPTTIFYDIIPEPETTTTTTTTPAPGGILPPEYGGIVVDNYNPDPDSEDQGHRRRKSLNNFDSPDDLEITNVCYAGVRTAAHPRYCDRFIECDQTGIFVKKCGPGTVFLPHLKVCGWQKDYVEPVPNRCGSFYTCDRGYKVARQCAYNYAFDFQTRSCSQRYRCSDYYSAKDQDQDVDA